MAPPCLLNSLCAAQQVFCKQEKSCKESKGGFAEWCTNAALLNIPVPRSPGSLRRCPTITSTQPLNFDTAQRHLIIVQIYIHVDTHIYIYGYMYACIVVLRIGRISCSTRSERVDYPAGPFPRIPEDGEKLTTLLVL